MPTKDPIARTSLHLEVTSRLRSLIVESHIKPGERVPELEISRDLGVSRTPIREALKVLASEGLVELLPLRGAVVKSFSPKDAADMLEVMGLLESYAAQKACKAAQSRIDHVLTMHNKMKTLFSQRKRPAYFDLNQKIHDALVDMADNESLSMVHSTMSKRMRSLRYSGNSTPENWRAALEDHERIAHALKKRDAQEMKQAVQSHFENTIKRVLNP
ncbi:GntR family transcriptional regulator [Limnohabitans sp. Rim8]|uniref:GntR family transcriptional regulator n=1 Tax=Limnohabitans sp. Rim8 TaxID=1100718 RepID=UPI00261812D5|nr:GntR family transcriptional regulator [Limnohabitans sp. Rim8]